MKTAILLLAALPALPVQAEELLPECMMDLRDFRLERQDFDADPGRFVPVYPMREAEGFVAVNWFGPQEGWRTDILTHCASGQSLVFLHQEPYDGPQLVYGRYREMIDSAERYSFRQIGEALAALGAQVRITNDDIGSCGCDVFGY